QKYKNKPHFILEKNKYKDLSKIIEKIKENTKKFEIKNNKDNVKNNIYSILLDQLYCKTNKIDLKDKIKEYLNKQKNLEYKKIFNNQYYNEITNLIEQQNNEKTTVLIKS
ncbi:plasmid maintenance protein, partial [Borreliella garinii]